MAENQGAGTVGGVVGGAVDGAVGGVVAVVPHVGKAGKAVVTGAARGAQAAAAAVWENRQDLADHAAEFGTNLKVAGVEGVKAVGAGAAALYEHRDSIAQGAATGVKAVGQASVETARCCGCIAMAWWNNTYNCVRPFCSHCGVGLSGGCGRDWPAYTRPGCDHLICPQCHARVDELPPCMKCEIRKQAAAKAKKKEETCCLGFIPWKSKKAAKVEGPDYHIGHLTTADVMEKIIPNLARNIADAKGLDTDELLKLMKDDGSKALLKALAESTSIPIQLR